MCETGNQRQCVGKPATACIIFFSVPALAIEESDAVPKKATQNL